MINAAVEASSKIPVKAIIADTTSGNTIRGIAAYRSRVPVLAHCYNEKTVRLLALSYGVFAEYAKRTKRHADFIPKALKNLVQRDDVSVSDEVIIISGSFGHKNGASFIEVGVIDQLLELIK